MPPRTKRNPSPPAEARGLAELSADDLESLERLDEDRARLMAEDFQADAPEILRGLRIQAALD